MKKLFSAMMLFAVTTALAQDIKLPAPQKSLGSMTVAEALNTRHSVRSFTNQELTLQQISNVCWAACGVSRDAEHRTSPTAMNFKEIRLYVFTKDAAYEYLPTTNTLAKKASGDNRNLVAGSQDFAKSAPVSFVMVIDFDKMRGKNEHSTLMGCVDAGNVSENINLYCQSVGLATVPRATMDAAGISKLLGLTDKQMPIMNNPVGYEKK